MGARATGFITASLLSLAVILFPYQAFATTCGFGSDIGSGQCQGFLTSGTTWTVPSDWSSTNTIEAIGGGGAGGLDGTRSASGGAGAYSKSTNVSLTPGATVGVNVGASGTSGNDGGDTYVCNSTSNCGSLSGTAVVVGAEGGKHGHYAGDGSGTQIGGAGGLATNGIGDTKYSGGNGGGYSTNGTGGGGGGGSAGPSGNGKDGGGNNASTNAGGSGGGSNGGSSTAGTSGSGNTGAVGGKGTGGSGGGTGGGVDSNAGNATAGSGAGGGSGGARSNGGNGAIDTSFDATHGAGGGGGGAGGASGSGAGTDNGGNGGTYGGGGGGNAVEAGTPGNVGIGGQGLIAITYTPSAPPAPSSSHASIIIGNSTVGLMNGIWIIP